MSAPKISQCARCKHAKFRPGDPFPRRGECEHPLVVERNRHALTLPIPLRSPTFVNDIVREETFEAYEMQCPTREER